MIELVTERPGGAGVEVRFVLDGDDAADPVGVRPSLAEFDPVVPATFLDEIAAGGAVDCLSDVAPRVARMRERVAVPRPVCGRVADDVEKVGVEFALAERPARSEACGVTLDDDGVPAATLRAELPRDEYRVVAVAVRRPRALGPPAGQEFEAELGVAGVLHGRWSAFGRLIGCGAGRESSSSSRFVER